MKMFNAGMNAKLGDDVMGDDPTVQELQSKCAKMFGKEEGLYVPTGTMSNLAAIMSHAASVPSIGKEIVVGADSHISMWEQGNVASFAGVHTRQIPDHGGVMELDDIRRVCHSDDDDHCAKTTLVCLENTHNLNGGRVLSKRYIDAVGKLVHSELEDPVRLHLDGARIFHAAVSLGMGVNELCSAADSVSICLSKGLGAPLGSVLVGESEFIRLAKRARKALGGGMRQSGVVAGMGLYALESHVERLHESHAHAQRLAKKLSNEGFHIALKGGVVDSNIVFFCLPDNANISGDDLLRRLGEEYNVKLGGGYIRTGERRAMFRVVTHLETNDEGIDRALEGLIALCL
uniref:Aromatic amino acid beta-eliminating lyase/threonine aldolase domain-containing protein n=2 Tax=Leptocylindrus danicus TaxID=163516 RepID=A0A7S2PMU0_9STRA